MSSRRKSWSFAGIPGGWSWPDNLPAESSSSTSSDARPDANASSSSTHARSSRPTASASTPHDSSRARPQRERTWKARTCRICLETVQPTFQPLSENIPSMFQGRPYVSFESEEGGRLLSPCKCKGSSKYVHEKCLQQWRHSDMRYGNRTYYQCPTCGFSYRLERLNWGRWVASTSAQILLTLLIFLTTIFILGFIADPIINLYMDPFDTIISTPLSGSNGYAEYHMLEDESTWIEHFAKGLASLGFVGAAKVFLYNGLFTFRFGIGGRGRANARDRFSGYTWIVILAGVLTFVYTVWKGVRAWSKRALRNVGERVMDVQGDDDDQDDDEEDADDHQ